LGQAGGKAAPLPEKRGKTGCAEESATQGAERTGRYGRFPVDTGANPWYHLLAENANQPSRAGKPADRDGQTKKRNDRRRTQE
jgi:hypothetical protein